MRTAVSQSHRGLRLQRAFCKSQWFTAHGQPVAGLYLQEAESMFQAALGSPALPWERNRNPDVRPRSCLSCTCWAPRFVLELLSSAGRKVFSHISGNPLSFSLNMGMLLPSKAKISNPGSCLQKHQSGQRKANNHCSDHMLILLVPIKGDMQVGSSLMTSLISIGDWASFSPQHAVRQRSVSSSWMMNTDLTSSLCSKKVKGREV